MQQAQKAEELNLPEQLYILLVNPDTGEPRFDRIRTERVLSVAIVWELLHSGSLDGDDQNITAVRDFMFPEPYLRTAAMIPMRRLPITGRRLAADIAAELHPVWKAIGEGMVNKHLVGTDIQTRFGLFHKRVLVGLVEARQDGLELSGSLRQAARAVWNSQYDEELAQTHPRLVARIVLLDNYCLLEPLLGSADYDAIAPHIEELRRHLKHAVSQADGARRSGKTRSHREARPDSGWYGGIYDSGSYFWIDTDHGHEGHHHHDAEHDDDAHDADGDSGDGGADSGGGSGGDGGGCGGCGGCGG